VLQVELAERGVVVSYGAVWHFVHAEGLSFKKPRWPASCTGPTSPAGARGGSGIRTRSTRSGWCFWMRPGSRPTSPPLRGWAPRGERLAGHHPHGHWRTLTCLAALRCDRSDAPCLFDGPINGKSFTAWVERALLPTLRPGDVVVRDNLGSHKGQAVRAAIRSAGAHLLFRPPYSPDLNPIAQVFAKPKHVLRDAAARRSESVTATIAEILDRFTPQECANYLTNAGYASS
jgi:transposase